MYSRHFGGRFLLGLLLSVQVAVKAVETPTLTAVAKNPVLRRRTPDFTPSLQTQTLFYGTGLDFGSDHAAKISFDPVIPTLLIEDVQDHLKHIECQNGYILISFHDDTTMRLAETSWTASGEFLIVASHFGCATNGEHSAYTASLTSTNVSALVITLTASETKLKACSEHMMLDLGGHIVPDIVPSVVPRYARPAFDSHFAAITDRQESAATTSDVQSASLSPSTSVPYSPPTISPTAASLAYSFDSFKYIDSTIVPPPSSILPYLPDEFVPPKDVVLKCLNCTLVGTMSLKAANLDLNTSSDLEATMHFFDDGWLEFDVNDMAANISFELDLLPGFSAQFVAELPSIPLGGINIAGVVALGLALKPTFPIGITLDSNVTLRSGFLLDVPQHSQIILNVSAIDDSSVTGFQDTVIKPLPFHADAADLSMTLYTGFKPQLILSAAALEDDIGVSGGLGVFLDLPKLIADVETLHNVSDKCNGSAPNGETNTYIQVKPSANFSFNGQWDLEVDLLSTLDYKRGGGQEWYEQTVTLEEYNQCLLWDSQTHSTKPAPSKTNGSARVLVSESDRSIAALIVLLLFSVAWM